MNEKEKSCCFTGHRVEKLPWGSNENHPDCVKLKNQIKDAIQKLYEKGVRNFLCGMATGGDTYFCEAVYELREEHDDVSLEAVVPWEGQAKSWPVELKERYEYNLREADFFTLISREYHRGCLMRRNNYMVDCSSYIISAYNGQKGGTQNTLLYAKRQGLECIIIDIDHKKDLQDE